MKGPMYVCAIVLAAGRSRRMGTAGNKVMMKIGGETVLCRLMRTIAQSSINEVVVVAGYRGGIVARHVEERIRPMFLGKRLIVARNDEYEDGMAVSLSVGAKALPPSADAFLLFLGDQPLVRRDTIDTVIEEYRTLGNRKEDIVLIHPRYKGKKGHPVLFSDELRGEAEELGSEDQPRYVTWKHRDRARILDVDDPGICADLDTPDDLERMRELVAGNE